MHYIGVDIGGMSIKGGIVDSQGHITNRFRLPIVKERSQEKTMEEVASLINKSIEESGLAWKDIKGIGVGCPGSINSKTGVCDYAGNLKWQHLPIAEILQKATGLTTKVTNDANAAALGENKFGVGKDYKNMLFITLGTGVGGGIICNGELYEGNEGKGAELGHSLLMMDGRPCTCGRHGCLEAYASVTALIKDTKEAMAVHPESKMHEYVKENGGEVNGLTAFETAKQGDPAAQAVVDQYIHFLGEGLINFINIFRPEAIILGGGLSGQKEGLTKPLIAYLEQKEYGFGGQHSPAVKVFTSELGNDAGILGAASLVLD